MADGVEKEVTTLLETNVLTKADIKVLLQWIDEMEEFGPEHIAKSSEWHDHALEQNGKASEPLRLAIAEELFIKLSELKL